MLNVSQDIYHWPQGGGRNKGIEEEPLSRTGEREGTPERPRHTCRTEEEAGAAGQAKVRKCAVTRAQHRATAGAKALRMAADEADQGLEARPSGGTPQSF